MKRITFFIFSIICFTACNNETDLSKPQEVGPQIELILPDAEEVVVYSTATENECRIETLWVIAFRGGSKIWAEKIDVSKISQNGKAAQLLPQLSEAHKPDPGDIVACIANVRLTSDMDTSSISTLNDINTVFRLDQFSHYVGGDRLPMYGTIEWSSSNYTCVMTRAVAKIQVRMGTSASDVITNFSAQNVTYRIYDFSAVGYIQPTYTGKPITSTSTKDFHLTQYSSATEALTNAYIHEYRSSINSILDTTSNIGISTFHPRRQYIILEKDNPPSGSVNNTFYRLDFYDSDNSVFIDTKRNHHYIFTINKVRSEGYLTSLEAQNSPGSNIEYTITVNDDSRYITSNGQYAIITNVDTVKIPTGIITNMNVALFRYFDPAYIIHSSSANSITVESGSIVPGSATLTISPSVGPISPSNSPLIISASSGLTQGVIVFRLGNITHRLIVKRQ